MPNTKNFMSDFRVGLVTFTSLLALIAGITFAGGDKGLLMQPTCSVHAYLYDVNGLKKGSCVTMGGMNIGKVTQVSFLENPKENLIDVTMELRADVLTRIKKDSKPTVRTQGMLGDRYMEISMGGADSPAFDPAKALEGSASTNFDDALQEARSTLLQTTKMMEAINQQQGTAGQFIYDQQLYKKMITVADQLSEVLTDFKQNPKKYIKLEVF